MSATLYRFFDGDDNLLYVGCSLTWPTRLAAHEREKDWWENVTRVTLDHFPTREIAAEAEVAAITHEGPRYNKRPGNYPTRPRKPRGSAVNRSAGLRVRRLRVDSGLTPEDLGEKLGISGRTIRRVEDGTAPTVRVAHAIATHFGSKTTEFWQPHDLAEGAGTAA